jgi:hypothetical protein
VGTGLGIQVLPVARDLSEEKELPVEWGFIVVRGFIPDGSRSGPAFDSEKTGLLRSPSGLNPLATMSSLSTINSQATEHFHYHKDCFPQRLLHL